MEDGDLDYSRGMGNVEWEGRRENERADRRYSRAVSTSIG
jgi:hypothetical protein